MKATELIISLSKHLVVIFILNYTRYRLLFNHTNTEFLLAKMSISKNLTQRRRKLRNKQKGKKCFFVFVVVFQSSEELNSGCDHSTLSSCRVWPCLLSLDTIPFHFWEKNYPKCAFFYIASTFSEIFGTKRILPLS